MMDDGLDTDYNTEGKKKKDQKERIVYYYIVLFLHLLLLLQLKRERVWNVERNRRREANHQTSLVKLVVKRKPQPKPKPHQ